MEDERCLQIYAVLSEMEFYFLNKNRRGRDKQHPNTVPNQTSESTRKHPKMCTIERNGTNESNACGKPKKTRILYGTPQQRRKQARNKNENTSRKEGNVI